MSSIFDDASKLPTQMPRARPQSPPHLLTWDAIPSTPSSSSSPASSPVMSPSSQAFDDIYSPHSKSIWQLSQSEPAISVDRGDSDGDHKIDVPSPRKALAARGNTVHVNIPTRFIGHTRALSDEDPVLNLSEGDPGVIMMDDIVTPKRGRSIAREVSGLRLGSSLPPKEPLLKLPLHIACQASTDAGCPNGTSCPYVHTHLKPKTRRRSRVREIQALSEQFNSLAESLSSKESTPKESFVLPAPKEYIVLPQLDSLGLPPNPLMRNMDLSQYTRSSRRKPGRSRAGSFASDVSKEAGRHSRRGSEAGTERHGRRGSSTKFTLSSIPPFKATSRRGSDASTQASSPPPIAAVGTPSSSEVRATSPNIVAVVKRPSTLLDDLFVAPPVPPQPQPLSSQPQTLYDSALKPPEEAQPQLQSPPMSPPYEPFTTASQQDKSTRQTRPAKGGALFANALAGLSADSKAKEAEQQGAAPFTKQQSMFGKSMFNLPLSSRNSALFFPGASEPQEKDSRRTSHSSKSSRSSNPHDSPLLKDPASPTYSSRTNESNSTDRTHSTSFNQPSFTSPMRPLFSGYEHIVPADLKANTMDEHVRKGAEERIQKQRDKDLRQALRLEKALEDKRSGLIKKLEWKPPVVETKGYGYGDGLEVKKEMTMPNGDVFKVLEWEERVAMEREVKKVEGTLVKVREDIVKNGGTAGQPISYKETSTAHITSQQDSAATTGEKIGGIPTKDKGKGRLVTEVQAATPQTPEYIVNAEREKALLFNKMHIDGDGRIDIINAYAANASPSERLRLAQRVPEDIPLPKLPVSKGLPEHLRVAPSVRAPTTSQPAPVVKRASVQIDESMFSNNPKQAAVEALQPTTENSLLDLFAGRPIFRHKAERLTEKSVKRHQDMLAEDEKRYPKDIGVMGPAVALPTAETKMIPSPTPAAAVKQAPQRPGRSMWADSPLPGTNGAVEDLGSPPIAWAKPRPASSVPTQEILSRPSSVLSISMQQSPILTSHTEKQVRRISMSNAKPGDETSTQTMEGLDFNESEDEDNDADDSRDFHSAEEGTDNEEEAQEKTSSINASTSAPVSLPTLQRKRSSTLTAAPLQAPIPEKKHRPSPLDDWTFDFASRKQRDVVSPGPFSSAASTTGASIMGGRGTPTRHYHHSSTHGIRRPSQESNQFPPLFGYGVAAPNNTPDSPPPRRYESSSPTAARGLPAERFTIANHNAYQSGFDAIEQSHNDYAVDARKQHEEPYFVVNRSSNVIDEAANLIEYSTARVMSGGVKIGSVLPRGVNGVIEEEEEDIEEEDLGVEFESPAPLSPSTLSETPVLASPGQLDGRMTLAAYPLGVPVPGHPQAVSTASTAPLVPSVVPVLQPITPVPIAPASHLYKRPSLALSSQVPHHAAHFSLPSPVTSTSGSQVAPVEYCGDFRTTGHCRFGARCRYSHDIEPRVRTSTSNAASRYRPSMSSLGSESLVSPRTKAMGIPPVPAGYQLSNVLPQPHHIPGIPMSQQPLSPFLFAHPSTVAHPLTAPAATAAANKGVAMANTEKAAKILKSLGITPQQLLAHQPQPTVMADGELLYDLTKGRSNDGGVLLGQDSAVPFPRSTKPDASMKEARNMVLMRYGTEQEKRAIMGSSAGMVMDGEEEDIWTVSQGRRSHGENEPESSADGQRRRGRPKEHDQAIMQRQHQSYAQHQPTEQDARRPVQVNGPVTYSPAQHSQNPNSAQYPMPAHTPYSYPQHNPHNHHHPMPSSVATVTPATTPSPVQSVPAPGGSLTQDEVIKVLTALGLSVPGLTTTPGHPPTAAIAVQAYPSVHPQRRTSSQSGQNAQQPRYPPGPYDYMHPSMHQ